MGKVRYKELSPHFEKLSKKDEFLTETHSNIRGGLIKEVLKLSVDNIKTYDKQSRKIFHEEDIDGLVSSIKEVGIINPLLVVKSPEIGYFKVINGERRLRAARKIGIDKVPCIILQNEDKSDLVALIDNIQRVDLHPIELAWAYDSLIKDYGDKKIISEKIGVAYTSFLETLKLKNLPEEIQGYLLDKNIRTRETFRRLLKLSDSQKMKELLGIVKATKAPEKKVKILEIYSKKNEYTIDLIKKSFSANEINEICLKLEETLKELKKLQKNF